MKVIIKKEVVEHIEDLISKIEIDPSIIKFEFIKFTIFFNSNFGEWTVIS